MLTAKRTYTGAGLNALYPDAKCDNVALQAGKRYVKGTVLGQTAGTGTAVNEKQTITITGTPTGGTFDLNYGNGLFFITGIAYNATAAAVAAAINAVLGTDTVQATGGALPGTPVVVEFINEAKGQSHYLMTAVSALTGGTDPAVAVTRTTVGKPAGGYFDSYVDGTNVASRILKYDVAIDQFGRVTYGTGNSTEPGQGVDRSVPAYFHGTFRCSDLVGLDAAGVADLGRLISGTAYSETYALLAVNGGG